MAENRNTRISDKLRVSFPFFYVESWDSAGIWVKILVSIFTVFPLILLLYCFVDVVCLRDAGIFTDSVHDGLHCLKLSLKFADKELFSVVCASATSYGKCALQFMSLAGCSVVVAWVAMLSFVGNGKRAWCMCWLWVGKIEGWILALLVSLLTLLNYVRQFKDEASMTFILALLIAVFVVIGAVCKLIKFLRSRNHCHRLLAAAKSWVKGTDWIIDKESPIIMCKKDLEKETERMEISIENGFVEIFYGCKGDEFLHDVENLMQRVAEDLRQECDEERKSGKRRDRLYPIVVPWCVSYKDYLKGNNCGAANKWRIFIPLEEAAHDFNMLFTELNYICDDLKVRLNKAANPGKKKQDTEETDEKCMNDVRGKTSESETDETGIDELGEKLCLE